MAAWHFDAPGGLQDFSDPAVWHNAMAQEANGIVAILVATVLKKELRDLTEADIAQVGPTLGYIDPTAILPPATAVTVAISPWGAFPRAVERDAPFPDFPDDPVDVDGAYRAAEHRGSEDLWSPSLEDRHGDPLDLPVRDRQDEYCEWVVRRDGQGKITKAIFVAEGYDYFAELFRHDETLVRDIYRDFTEIADLETDDLRAVNGVYYAGVSHTSGRLIAPGEFNWRNPFNNDPGIVHLSHRANSLGAEVNLAGVSGLARKTSTGAMLQPGNPEKILCCSQGGNPNRNSDPLIGEQAYSQVLAGKHYTLANPVGLYIANAEDGRLTLPSGEPAPREWWRAVRGQGLWDPSNSRILRLEVAVPPSEGFALGDLLVDGEPLLWGGQLARLLSIHLFVTLWDRAGGGIGPIVDCNATCCRKQGTEQLVLSNGACGGGYELAFDDLVAPADPQDLDLAVSAAPASIRPPSHSGRLG